MNKAKEGTAQYYVNEAYRHLRNFVRTKDPFSFLESEGAAYNASLCARYKVDTKRVNDVLSAIHKARPKPISQNAWSAWYYNKTWHIPAL